MCEVPVDGERVRVPAGHAGDEEGEGEGLPEELHVRVDLRQVEFRQRVMDKCHRVQPCRDGPEADVLRERDGNVLLLA